MEEFEFKIGLLKDDEMDADDSGYPPSVAIVHHHLTALLGMVQLMKDGQDVTVNGFRLIGEEKVYPLGKMNTTER